ncbi:DUF4913 domain-containing protein [Agromyces sp. NPDC058126]|uniref:DUF4913 domain-containing protein n=1 Tax=Agromyces sp. NPDC058126 TaxID=3346350 RepID=UPI0036DD35BA
MTATTVTEATVPASTYFPDVFTWVEYWLLPHWKRELNAARWDARWWEYTEVLSRFEALWRAWEVLRLDGGTGIAVYFRDYLDPAMQVITGRDGPFWRIQKVGERILPEPWPNTFPPGHELEETTR